MRLALGIATGNAPLLGGKSLSTDDGQIAAKGIEKSHAIRDSPACHCIEPWAGLITFARFGTGYIVACSDIPRRGLTDWLTFAPPERAGSANNSKGRSAVLSIPDQLNIPAAGGLATGAEDTDGALPVRGAELNATEVLLIRKLGDDL